MVTTVFFYHFQVTVIPLNVVGVARAVAFADEGFSQRRIAWTLGVPRTTVWDTIRRFRETRSYTRRPGQGRHRCTSARDDRYLVSCVSRDRFYIAAEARHRLYDVRNVSVSGITVRRRLAKRDLRAFRRTKLS